MQINIDESLYNQLELDAENNFRTPELQLSYLLTQIYRKIVSDDDLKQSSQLGLSIKRNVFGVDFDIEPPSRSAHVELWNNAKQDDLGIVDVSSSREAFERGIID